MSNSATTVDDLSKADALILSGGLGTRLRSVLADSPKVLAPVCGRPWIFFLLDQLRRAGVARIILATGYRCEMVREVVGNNYLGTEVLYSEEQQQLGTGGALALARPLLKSESLIVLNGDSYCDVNFEKLFAFHCVRQADVTQVVVEQGDTSRYGAVLAEDDGRVVQFVEKGGSSGSGWINAGIYVLRRELLSELEQRKNISLERELFPHWLSKRFYAFPADPELFIDIGTPQSFAQAQKLFDGRLPEDRH